MRYKSCPRCEKIKQFDEFSERADGWCGLQYWCKKCVAIYAHQNQHRRVEYNRKHQQRPETKQKNVERITERRKNKDPRIIAGQKLGAAVQSGRIEKPSTCSICNKSFPREKIEGHHADYDYPLAVIWCCRQCHINSFHQRKSKYFKREDLKT